ncbi:3-mercaptopyruvate sulfurtransferase [uncultured Methylovirgula sp.]|uniref:3-mercaptopyruvate sulfurtransferase n=1 Tax=uncultured Methylovirgula sp. TaxID=1285960 RepID=UPI0026371D9D|nr:3-mercaptopyruvate sulfurtransferase [uncultured Methylovirgula sp.]
MSGSLFVSTEWLAAHLGEPDLVIIDGTFLLPSEGRNAYEEYRASHIPGAVFFDIDEIADHSTNLPHMLPTPEAFAKAVGALGISDTSRIVVYDTSNFQGGARVWWTLRLYGAKDVKLLAGGFARWKAEGRPLEQGQVRRPPQTFTAHFDEAGVASLDDVRAIMRDGSRQIVDARPAARFRGEAEEPRPGVRSGHIPGSFNLPSRDLVKDGEIKPPQEIAAAFGQAGVDISKPVLTTCGSGVTAAILLLGLATLGQDDVRLYDGSWSEWGARSDTPIEKS